MKTKHYHNTNNVDDTTERLEAQKNMKQEDVIYHLFVENPEQTASEVWAKFGRPNGSMSTPLTSIRRGMSNLQRQGVLWKTDKTKQGLYGKPECVYRLVRMFI